MSAVCHEATIAITRLLAAGRVEQPIAALLARIEELEREQDEECLEIARLRNIEDLAQYAADYHRRGYTDDPFHDEYWDDEVMRGHMDDLRTALLSCKSTQARA